MSQWAVDPSSELNKADTGAWAHTLSLGLPKLVSPLAQNDYPR